MGNLRRVKVSYTGAAVEGTAGTNFYFAADFNPDQNCVDSVEAFYTELRAHLCSDITVSTNAGIEYIDEATGDIVAILGTIPYSASGVGGSSCLPFAVQGLIRSRTGQFVSGREVRGLWFIPGFMEDQSDEGVPTAGALSAMQNAVNALISDEGSTAAVYSTTHGQGYQITSGGPWDKWAVLRSRRD